VALPDVTAGATGHVTHHNVLHDWTQIDEAVRYVSKGAQASDSNDGLTPMLAKATIASAYAVLPSTGGVILIGAGRHDVGATGLELTRTKPVGLRGMGMWRRATPLSGNTTWITGGGTVIYSSTGSPTQLVSFPNPGTATNGRGFEARNLVFEIKAGMTYGILANSVNEGYVEDCAFFSKEPTAIAVAVTQDGVLGDDASWWRIMNNTCFGAGLFHTLTFQHNQHVISGNFCWGGTQTFVLLRDNHRSAIRDNNFEGSPTTGTPAVFMELENCWACQTSGNAGESTTTGAIFCQLDASHGCLLMDIGTSSPDATDKLYDFINGSQDNLVLSSVYTPQDTLYTSATSTVFADSGTAKLNYRITSGSSTGVRNGTWLPKFKTGAGTPEAVVTGYRGDMFLRSDGGAGTTLYIKESGDNTNTGWIAK
jgi:hypothetical protein